MRKLYYHPICPFSRQARIYLQEAQIEFALIKEDYWKNSGEFSRISPSSILPLLIEDAGLHICGIYPILEYLHEKYPNFYLMPEDFDQKTEIRRLISWFNDKFYHEVTKILINEKVLRPIAQSLSPRSDFLKIAKSNSVTHLEYISELLKSRHFISSEKITCADIACTTHLSILDYFGEINWGNWPDISHYYSVIKSKPSFQTLLQDRIAGFVPAKNYEALDF